MVRIRVLGALTAADERGELDLGGPRQRGVLARLLVARGEVVPVDRLIDDLWRGEPPPRALGALQAYVSNLRRLLEPRRPPRAPATVLISRAPGYAVRLDAEAVDAWVFGAELDAAAGLDPRERRRALERALSRWQGPAYAAYAEESWASAEAARLEELRSAAREQLAATLLELDEPALAAAQAEVLSREHPLREEGWRLTALARYRAGRQAEALAALRQAREVLAEELGIDPGPALTRLEADILAQRIPMREHAVSAPALERDPVVAHDPTLARDPALTTDPAVAGGPGFAHDPTPARDQTPTSDPAGARGPGLAHNPAVARDHGLTSDPAGAHGPALAHDRAVTRDDALTSGPAVAVDPALARDPTVAGDPASAGDPAVASDSAVARNQAPAIDAAAAHSPALARHLASARDSAVARDPVSGNASALAGDPASARDPAIAGDSALAQDSASARDQVPAIDAAVARDTASARGPVPEAVGGGAGAGLFGRAAELTALSAAAQGEGPRAATLVGEAGSGKSTVLHHIRAALRDAGFRVVLGRCPEDEAAPSAWPWVEMLRVLVGECDPGDLASALAPLLTDGAGPPQEDRAHGRFLLHRAVCGYLTAVAADRPLAILLDDAHRGDAETAALLAAVATRVPALVVIGYRPDEAPPALADALATLATTVRARVRLHGLGLADSGRLVAALTGSTPADSVVETLYERTGGNPFYLTEFARLLQSEGEVVAASEVPQGVRDVLRRRLSRLPETAVALLRLAAVIGREFDLEVLVRAAEVGEDDVLDAVEAGVLAGLLDEPASGRGRFTHILVRDTLLGDVPRVRRDRWHRRVAAAIEEIDPGDVAALAHHYGESVTPLTARRAADYAVAAAERAERRYAHDVAAAGYERAAAALERHVGADTVAERVAMLCRAGRSHLAGGAGLAARATRDRAAALAEEAGRPDLLVRAFTAWDTPTPWMNRLYGVVEHQVVARLEDALRFPGLTSADRCRLLVTLVDEIGGEAGERAARAAAEAETIARELGDDTLLAPALQARASLYDTPERGRLGAELIEIGLRTDDSAYLVLGHTISVQAAAFAADLAAVREHLDAATVLADRYQWRQAQVANTMARGLLALASGDADAAERHYLRANEMLTRAGILNAGGILLMAVFAVRWQQGRAGELAGLVDGFAGSAPQASVDATVDFQVLALLAGGDRAAAERVRRRARPVRHDLFRSLFLTLRGMTVAALGTPQEAGALYRDLLPYRDRLGGADTGSYVVGPVDTVLGDLAARRGEPGSAAEHYRAALRVARRCGNPVWIAAARERLDR
ncbi:BTAD domain-containing putative transcriptional regulator [Nocardia beijingensis]|uniref:BTAD domain-containing putative transcriptional regulator n=1 Tax=Nocardia beijingensis TaxID=95162 RepID=UPI00344D3DB1